MEWLWAARFENGPVLVVKCLSQIVLGQRLSFEHVDFVFVKQVDCHFIWAVFLFFGNGPVLMSFGALDLIGFYG